MKKLLLVCCLVWMPMLAAAAPVEGERLPTVVLEGGRLDGRPWSSEELMGRVFVLSYVDPDHGDLNETAGLALEREGWPSERYGSVAILNMRATWIPESFVDPVLNSKQEQFPRTVYLKDQAKVLVQAWGLADNASSLLAIGPDGRLLFHKSGKLSDADLARLIRTIRDHLP